MFRHNVLAAVFLEQFPLFRIMPGLVPGTVPVASCRLARNTEIPDQCLTGCQFLFILGKPDRLAGCIQAWSLTTVKSVNHRASPLIDRSFKAGTVETVPLERCVIRMLDHLRIF